MIKYLPTISISLL